MEIPDLSGFNLSEKEEKILKAAIIVFSEKGFSAATTNEIAKSAGVAEGTIFRYFKTKKDILRGIMIQTINLLSSKVVMDGVEKIFKESEDKDLRYIIKEVLYDRMKLFDSIFPMARVVITEALFHEDVREAIYNNIIVRALDIFKKYHSKLIERNLIRKDIQPEILLRCLLSNIAALIAQRRLFSDKLAIADLDMEVDKMVDLVLFGITPKN